MESTNESIHIKINHHNQIRRFLFNGTQFCSLKDSIAQLFTLTDEFVIKYQDDESEYVTLDCQEDLVTALTFSPKLLRIFIEKKNDPNGKHRGQLSNCTKRVLIHPPLTVVPLKRSDNDLTKGSIKPITYVFSADLREAHPVDDETAKFLNRYLPEIVTIDPISYVPVTNGTRIFNISGTTGDDRFDPYGSWITWYRGFTGNAARQCCCLTTTCNTTMVGGHMYIGSYNLNNPWYIMPICNWHNNASRTGPNYPFPVTQGTTTALGLPHWTAQLVKEHFEARRQRIKAGEKDPTVLVQDLPSFTAYKQMNANAHLSQTKI